MYQKKSDLYENCREFRQADRNGRIEAVVRSTEKRVCTVFVNQWAASGEKQDEERFVSFRNSQDKACGAVLNFFVVCLID